MKEWLTNNVSYQALPRLTNREKVMEMVDPALKGHYSKKDLIQVNLTSIFKKVIDINCP